MIKELDFIYFNGNSTPGKFANGAGIYGVDINVGNSRQPTTIKMDIVSEGGDYGNILYGKQGPQLSTSETYKIDIGKREYCGPCGTVKEPRMSFKNLFLTSFSISEASENKTASLTFKDRSILFDKIQVGVLLKHHKGEGKFGSHVSSKSILVEIPIQCEDCTTFKQRLVTVVGKKWFNVSYINDTYWRNCNGQATPLLKGYFVEKCTMPYPPEGYGSVSDDGGGYIILGRGKPKQADCEIEKCDYNFSDLLNSIQEMTGLTLGGIFAGGEEIHDQFGCYWKRHADKNPYIRKDWDGTLREVLNNWCDLFQCSYTLSFDGTMLIGLDLSGDTTRKTIDEIERDIRGANTISHDGFLVEDLKTDETIDNVEKKSLITNYSKAPRAEKFNKDTYFYSKVKVMTPEDVVGGSRYYGRNKVEFYNSIALTQFSSVMREVYLARENCLEALGFRIAGKINPDWGAVQQMILAAQGAGGMWQQGNINPRMGGTQKELFQHVMSWLWGSNEIDSHKLNSMCDGKGQFVRQNLENNPGLMGQYFDVYIGYYSASLAKTIEEWDKKAAGFMGQWCYFPGGVPRNIHICNTYSKREVTFNTEPATEKYKGYHWLPQDFKDLLIDDGTPPSYLLTLDARNAGVRHLNIGQVSANHWGTNQKQMEEFMADPVTKKDHITGFLDQGFDPSGLIYTNSLVNPYNGQTMYAGKAARNQYDDVLTQLNVGNYKPIIATIADKGEIMQFSSKIGDYITGWSHYLAHQHQMEQDNPDQFISGEKPAIIVVPKGSRQALKFQNNLTVNTGVYVTENPDSWLAQQLSEVGTLDTVIPPECEEKETYCERSLVQQMCNCADIRGFNPYSTTFAVANKANKAVFENYISNQLSIAWTPWYASLNPSYIKMTKVVFPVMSMITGHIHRSINFNETVSQQLEILGDFPGFSEGKAQPNDKVTKTDLQYIDATQDVDNIVDPKNESVVKLTNFGLDPNAYNTPLVALSEIHDFNYTHIKNQSQTWPKKTISFKVNGTFFGPLLTKKWLSPAFGLTNWNISFGSAGVSSSFTFSSRPAMLPKKEEVISKIETRFMRL
jgi:hypothetical protein